MISQVHMLVQEFFLSQIRSHAWQLASKTNLSHVSSSLSINLVHWLFLSLYILSFLTYKPLQRIKAHSQFFNKIAPRSRIGLMQQIRSNCPRGKCCRQNIETRRREKKKQTMKIESRTQTWEETITTTLTVNRHKQQRHQNTSVQTVLLLFCSG